MILTLACVQGLLLRSTSLGKKVAPVVNSTLIASGSPTTSSAIFLRVAAAQWGLTPCCIKRYLRPCPGHRVCHADLCNFFIESASYRVECPAGQSAEAWFPYT